MAKATWKLFQKHRMEVMAYPALISVALVIAVLLVFNWNHTVLPIRILGIAFIVLQFAVIPLGARRAQAKTCRKAIRDAEKRGEYPARVEFLFQETISVPQWEGSHVGSLPGGQPFGRSEGLAVPLFRAGGVYHPRLGVSGCGGAGPLRYVYYREVRHAHCNTGGGSTQELTERKKGRRRMQESERIFIAENATLLREASGSSTDSSYDPEQHL